jgi:hypothetical protein
MLGSGFSFIHWQVLELPAECLVEQRFLEFIEGSDLLVVEGFQTATLVAKCIEV